MKYIIKAILLLVLIKPSIAQDHNFYYQNNFTDITKDTLLKIISNNENIWQIGYSSKDFFNGDELRMPPAIMTDTINDYPINTNSSFEITFGTTLYFLYHFFMIQFSHKYQTDIGKDGGFIEISYDNGTSWENIINDTVIYSLGYLEEISNFYSKTDTLADGVPAFSGQTEGWIQSKLFWSWPDPFNQLGKNINIKLKFTFRSDSIMDNMAGWIIDNIELSYSWFESVENHSQYFNSSVFPNPVKSESYLIFNNHNKEDLVIYIYSANSTLLMSIKTFQEMISIHREDFEPGLYLYRILNPKTRNYSNGKFVIN